MLTVGVLYPAANSHIGTVVLGNGTMCGIFVCGMIIYHSVGFLHCPSHLLRAMRRPTSRGMGKRNPHAFFLYEYNITDVKQADIGVLSH